MAGHRVLTNDIHSSEVRAAADHARLHAAAAGMSFTTRRVSTDLAQSSGKRDASARDGWGEAMMNACQNRCKSVVCVHGDCFVPIFRLRGAGGRPARWPAGSRRALAKSLVEAWDGKNEPEGCARFQTLAPASLSGERFATLHTARIAPAGPSAQSHH